MGKCVRGLDVECVEVVREDCPTGADPRSVVAFDSGRRTPWRRLRWLIRPHRGAVSGSAFRVRRLPGSWRPESWICWSQRLFRGASVSSTICPREREGPRMLRPRTTAAGGLSELRSGSPRLGCAGVPHPPGRDEQRERDPEDLRLPDPHSGAAPSARFTQPTALWAVGGQPADQRAREVERRRPLDRVALVHARLHQVDEERSSCARSCSVCCS